MKCICMQHRAKMAAFPLGCRYEDSPLVAGSVQLRESAAIFDGPPFSRSLLKRISQFNVWSNQKKSNLPWIWTSRSEFSVFGATESQSCKLFSSGFTWQTDMYLYWTHKRTGIPGVVDWWEKGIVEKQSNPFFKCRTTKLIKLTLFLGNGLLNLFFFSTIIFVMYFITWILPAALLCARAGLWRLLWHLWKELYYCMTHSWEGQCALMYCIVLLDFIKKQCKDVTFKQWRPLCI